MTGGGEETEDTAAALSFIGTELGSYRLEELLGEGGMGWVYLARHTAIGRQVAIKMLRPGLANDPMAVGRFFAEAQVVNRISHENIVEIFDCVSSSEEHVAYLVLEPLEGRDVLEILQAGETISLERSLTIMIQVARALAAAHEAGVVHRDLKPANIFITRRSGQEDFVKVLDFGIAKLRNATSSATRMTQVGTSLGTPAYLSPEQALGADVDPRTDIYSFGVILYELATGVLPFDSTSVTEMVSRHVLEQPKRPRDLSEATRSIPQALDDLIVRCLAKKPEERPASMADVAIVLEEVKRRLGEVPAPVVVPAAEPPRRRGRGWLIAGVAVLLGGAAAAAWKMGELPLPSGSDVDVSARAVAVTEPAAAPSTAAVEAPPAAPAGPAIAPVPAPEPEESEAAPKSARPVRPAAVRKAAPGRPPTSAATPSEPAVRPPVAPTPSEPAPTRTEIASPPPAVPAPARPAPTPARPAVDRGSLDAVPSVARLSVSGLPRAEIDGAMKRVAESLRGCYRSAAKKADRTPAVTLTISFAIDEGGAVRRVQVSGDTLGLATCVQGAVSKVRSRVPPDVGQASAIAVVKFQPTR